MAADVQVKLEAPNSCCVSVLSLFPFSFFFFGYFVSIGYDWRFLVSSVRIWLLFQWKNKYSKLEEKRNALRQAVKLLEQQIDKIQAQAKKGNDLLSVDCKFLGFEIFSSFFVLFL